MEKIVELLHNPKIDIAGVVLIVAIIGTALYNKKKNK